MSKQTLVLLAVMALAAVSAAFLLQPQGSYQPVEAADNYLPGLLAEADSLNKLALYSGGGELIGRFSRDDGRWISLNPAGYPADWDNIRNLVAGLAQARVIELKTATPDYYHRLGVRDSSDPEAAGILVELASETSQWSVIVGNRPASRQGQYARIPDQPVSVLLDREITLSRDPVGWLEQEIINLPAAQVSSVTIQNPDSAPVRISKTSSEDTDFLLLDVPDNRVARTGFTINGIAAGLSNLEMQEVRAAHAVDFSGGTTTRFESFDGRRVSAELVQAEEKSWIRISAEYVPAGEQADEAGDDQTEAAGWVDKLNADKSDWAFAIPQYKYDTLTRELENLLEAVEE